MFGCFAALDSAPNQRAFDLENVTQLSEARSYSVHSENVISARVSHLFFLCLPFAILWVVALFIIDPSQRFSGWPFAHILQEIIEGVFPAPAYPNAATAVMMIILVSWVIASGFHRAPRIVSFRLPSAVFWISFLMRASARFGVSCGECTFWNVDNLAAFAPTNNPPHRVTIGVFSVWSIRDYGKLAKYLTNDGYSLLHNSISLICATLRDGDSSPKHFYFINAIWGRNQNALRA